MSDVEVHRDLGRMEAEISATRELLDEVRKDVKAMREDWTAAKSGTRVFLGIAAVVGAVLMKALDWALSQVKL